MNWILAGIITAIIWFVAGAILYLNPMAKEIQDKHKKDPAVKKWKKQNEFMMFMFFFGVLIPSIIFAYVLVLISPVLPSATWPKILAFGLLLVGIKIIPRWADMAAMSSYPKDLLVMDLINGSIAMFVVSASLVMML